MSLRPGERERQLASQEEDIRVWTAILVDRQAAADLLRERALALEKSIEAAVGIIEERQAQIDEERRVSGGGETRRPETP